MNEKLFLYGAGGHAKVILGILNSNKKKVDGIFDDDNEKWGKMFLRYKVYGYQKYVNKYITKSIKIIVSIGENTRRRLIVENINKKKGIKYETAVHINAYINERVNIQNGTVIMAGAVVNCDTRIGAHVIINTSSSIDHDCEIEDYVHISPGAHIGGNVKIGQGSWVGIGSSIINNCSIGCNVIVGAGAVVVKDVPDSWVVVGSPARYLRMNEK